MSVSYGDPDKFRVSASATRARSKFDQSYRNTGVPATSPIAGTARRRRRTFDWGTKNTQENWLVAVLADWVPMDKLRLTTSYS